MGCSPGDGRDAGEDEVDAVEELLAVVVVAQLRRHLVHERELRRIELRPLRGDAGAELYGLMFGDDAPHRLVGAFSGAPADEH